MGNKAIVITLVLLLAASFLPHIHAGSKTITVPTDYPDIQSAIDHASTGDVITVQRGEYSGFKVSKSVIIIGTGPGEVIVYGKVSVSADNVKICSMKIVLRDPSGGLDSAVQVFGKNTVLTNVVIDSEGSGIQIGNLNYWEGDLSIEDSSITAGKSKLSPIPAGIWGVCSSLTVYEVNVTVANGFGIIGCKNTDIHKSNVSSLRIGVKIGAGTIKGSWISSQSEDGVEVAGTRITIESNHISGSIGVDLQDSSLAENVIKGNTIVDTSIGIRLAGRSNIIQGNIISGNHAIELYGDNNKIIGNLLMGGRGIHGLNGHGNEVAYNAIYMTGSVGIYMSKSTFDNVIYGNAFWHCYNYEAADESGGNSWYIENEIMRLGNYWSYHEGPDADNDGIIDVPYHVATTTDKEILDKYPLVSPPEIPWSLISMLISTTTGTTTTQPTEAPTETSAPNTGTPSTSLPYNTTSIVSSLTQQPIDYSTYVVLGVATIAVAVFVSLLLRRRAHR